MHKILFRYSPALCFFLMPISVFFLIGAMKLGLVTPNTQVPDLVANFLNWRNSSAVFLSSGLVGILVCLISVFYVEKFQNKRRHRSKAQRIFNLAASFLANNFFYWSGNFLAYSTASNFLEFIEPISQLIPMAVIFLLVGFAIKLVGGQFIRSSFTPD